MGERRLIRALARACREHVLAEKWLIAPSNRVGFQWLDAVAMAGQPVLNVRPKTLRHLALELASPELDRRGLAFLRGAAREVVAATILARTRSRAGRYLTTLEPSAGLIRTIDAAILELRLAGISSSDLDAAAFEVRAKGLETKALLAEYEKTLESDRLADHADVLRIAAGCAGAIPEGVVALLPRDLLGELRALERALWEAFPPGSRLLLDVDEPAAAGRGTWKLFRAAGEANEVREVFRRCAENAVPLDDVELLHTDETTYVPLVFELAFGLRGGDDGDIPVTFAEGIPTHYSRPGRMLSAFLSWMRDGFPQPTLVRMVQDGLLALPGDEVPAERPGFTRLAGVLRALPIGSGSDRYLAAIDAAIRALSGGDAAPSGGAGFDEAPPDPDGRREARLRRLGELTLLRRLAAPLLELASGCAGGQRRCLASAATLLENHARRASELDEYSLGRLVTAIRELEGCLGPDDIEGLDVPGWLGDLPLSTRVLGSGPRPGCLHVASVRAGGFSGRGRTFIVGLDDARFPGSGTQDPLLLDGERSLISPDLRTAASSLARRVADFQRLLGRLGDEVTLSFPCRSLEDDRELFPSPVFWSAFRILSGKPDGDLVELKAWVGAPASFCPGAPGRCIDGGEWWLWRLCARGPVDAPEGAVAAAFPHLGRGLVARRERESDRFTEFDGWVPEAGRDLDPTRSGGPVLSASRLERLGACPLEYFFAYILGIEPPEEVLLDPSVWLDPMERGSLLHEVFRTFMADLHARGELPGAERHAASLEAVLDAAIAAWRERKPPLNREAYQRECDDLRTIARIFLVEEETHCRGSRPVYFEASIGLEGEGDGTPLDTPEPAEVRLPGGKSIRARGRIDRIDELPGEGTFAVWDYKTGGTWGYSRQDPFMNGRRIQGTLYLAMAEPALRRLHRGARVASFGYFFPGIRAHGDRMAWTAKELEEGGAVLERLCALLSTGCFPFTSNERDVTFSDYAAAFGDVGQAAGAARRKLRRRANGMLEPLRSLREDELGEEGEEG